MTENDDTLDRYTTRRKEEDIVQGSNVSLDNMDGYGFQKFVTKVFQKLGFQNVSIGPAGADEGIDIRMEQRTDLGTVRYVVECKHHAEGVIGRPVIQKLHSAIITKAINKGIVVTSGYFSSDAIQYAENVGIELFDIDKLKQLARKVGFSIREESALLIENCFPISEESTIKNLLHSFLENDLMNYDEHIADVVRVSLVLLPTYMIDYTIDARFSTSAGMIHTINKSAFAFFSEVTGILAPLISDPFVGIKHMISETHLREIKVQHVEKGEYTQTFRDIRENAREGLRKQHTETVSYYGRNNVHYTKTCIPSKKDVVVRDVKRVYLPIWKIVFSILKNSYNIAATETSGNLNVWPLVRSSTSGGMNSIPYPENCMVCSHEMRESYVCKECGAIVCEKDSFDCKICGKVVCKEDVVTKKKYILFKERYCPKCAQSLSIERKNV